MSRQAAAPRFGTKPCLRVGAAAISITPTPTTGLQGYGVRFAAGVDEPLVASALAVGSDHIDWLLISLDLIGVDRVFSTHIRDTLAQRLSMRRDGITLACSHTHSGPPSLPRLGPVISDQTYLELLETRLMTVAETAASCRQSATLRVGAAEVRENINRRQRKNGQIEIGIDPDGPADQRVWVARWDALAGSVTDPPMALIVQYACHATCSGEISSVSSDWPGVMRKTLQQAYDRHGVHPVVCFIQGCAGDVTHRIGRDPRSWPEHFGAASSLQASIMGRLVAAGAIAAIERAAPAPAASVSVTSAPVALRFRNTAGSEQTELQVVRIGGSLPTDAALAVPSTWFVFLPGEPLAAYGDVLRRAFDSRFGARLRNVVVCGYANDLVGYFCTRKAIREGGYEATYAHKVFHRPAPFAGGTLSVIRRACTTAAARLDPPQRRWGAVTLTLRSIRSLLRRRPQEHRQAR